MKVLLDIPSSLTRLLDSAVIERKLQRNLEEGRLVYAGNAEDGGNLYAPAGKALSQPLNRCAMLLKMLDIAYGFMESDDDLKQSVLAYEPLQYSKLTNREE